MDAQLLQDDFTRGMRRDSPRNQMQQGSLWNVVDCIAQEDAALRERGGWSNAAATSSITASSTGIAAGIYAPFSAGAQNLAIDTNGQLFKFTGVAAVTSVTAAQAPAQNPVFHNNLVIIPHASGSGAVKKYDGSTYADLAATAPNAKYATVFKDYTVLSGNSATADRVWFSQPGDPTQAWDTVNDFQDFILAVRGLASLRNVLLVFHDSTTSRMRGDTPPADGNMVVDDPAFQVGCIDARSIAYWNEAAVWCSAEGVFLSDGITLTDLSDKGDMVNYWRDTFSSYTSSWTVAGGVFRNFYFICVMNGATFVDAFMVDLNTAAWTRLSNVDAKCFWLSIATFDEMYWGRVNAGMVASMSSIWSPASGTKNDGDGDAVIAVIETPYYQGRPGLKAWKRGYLGYELTDFATDNPTVAVTLITTPEDTSYGSTLKSFAETSTYDRQRFDLVPTTGGGIRAPGVAFKLTRAAAGDFKLYSIEAEVHKLDGTRIQ